ncbi:NYN domain-containing protein [Inhella sp. 4Y17]|uniref:NYN domain-containing protein n=1 Tax=Inhella gelatinilytica TaxID=2795030 RepID=A0A931IWI7_9BURK|nr:NYN domain-containing protein [Inhella gelatinilytica]
MNSERPARIALLIDADNSPAGKIDLILTELATLGVANVRRAYGNWKKDALKGWEKLLHEHAIRPMQQFDYSKGKNASDMAMVIDALELLYTDKPDAFGIVSSDADFTPLVMHLRAKGAAVYGFGNRQTPQPFVNACSQFLYLDKVDSGSSGANVPHRMSGAQLRQDAKLVTLLRHAVQAAGGDEGWAMAGNVSQYIRNQAPFDPRNYGFASFSRLLEATNLFELRREGSVAWVREKRESKPERRTEVQTEVDTPRLEGLREPAEPRKLPESREPREPRGEGRRRGGRGRSKAADSEGASELAREPSAESVVVALPIAAVEDRVAEVVADLMAEAPPAPPPTAKKRAPRKKAAAPAALPVEPVAAEPAPAPAPAPRRRRSKATP